MAEKKSVLQSEVADAMSRDPLTVPDKPSIAVEKEESDNASMHWYVVQTRSGYERQVLSALEERIQWQGLGHKFGEIIVPTEEVVELRQGRKRKTARKFYPGYVLIQMEMDEDSWYLVKKTPGIVKFIGGTNDKPISLSLKEVEKIQQRMREGIDKPRPKVLFQAGEAVCIVDGPFIDFRGEIEEVNYEKHCLRVSVTVFGRSTPVQLEFHQVKKI